MMILFIHLAKTPHQTLTFTKKTIINHNNTYEKEFIWKNNQL